MTAPDLSPTPEPLVGDIARSNPIAPHGQSSRTWSATPDAGQGHQSRPESGGHALATRTVVLGGGSLGLTVALRLAQRGEPVTLIERETVPGGLAAGFQPAPERPGGGPYLDRFYHHLFRSDTSILALIEEMGLGAQVRWEAPVNTVLLQGKIWQPYSPMGLLRFPLLPLVDRLRMGAVLALLKLWPDAGFFARHTAGAWLRRWMGPRAFSLLWEPLLRAKFGARADDIAMPWFWSRIHCRSFRLGYLEPGHQAVYDRMVAEIRRLGGEVRLGSTVEHVVRDIDQADEKSWSVTWRDTSGAGVTTRCDRVVSTLPTRLTARIVSGLPEAWRARHDWGEAFGAHCLVLAMDRPLLPNGAYWLNVNDPGYPFLVVVEHTNFVPATYYGGRHLVYLGNYHSMDHPIFARSIEDVRAEFLPALQRVVPTFDPASVRESWMFGAPYAQPIVTREYPAHIPPLRGPLPGLWIGSMFQVYPQDRGQNYSVALANRLVLEMIGAEA